MAFNISLIIIQNTDNFKDEGLLLQKLGYYCKYEEDTILSDCINPDDGSVSIGYYNDHIIVCPDSDVTANLISDKIDFRKRFLVELFPTSEILIVSCESYSNYHGYLFIKEGSIHRIKALSADDGFYYNFGDPMEEEKPIYAESELKNGEHIWKYGKKEDDYYEEQQMMEIFTSAVAKRLLGVRLDTDESDELWEDIPFRKYIAIED